MEQYLRVETIKNLFLLKYFFHFFFLLKLFSNKQQKIIFHFILFIHSVLTPIEIWVSFVFIQKR